MLCIFLLISLKSNQVSFKLKYESSDFMKNRTSNFGSNILQLHIFKHFWKTYYDENSICTSKLNQNKSSLKAKFECSLYKQSYALYFL